MEANEHRGAFVQNIVNQSSISIEALAKKLRKSRGTIYNYFDNAELDFLKIAQIGRAIGHDFSKNYPELIELKSNMVMEEMAEYGKHDELIDKAKSEIDKWKTIAFESTKEVGEWKEKYYQLALKCNEKLD